MIQLINRKIRNKKGFTLIELIVVIAILGILAAIAVPRFAGVSANAQVKADQATARTIKSAVTMVEGFYSTNFSASNADHLNKLNDYLDNITVAATPATPSTWGINETGTEIKNPSGTVINP